MRFTSDATFDSEEPLQKATIAARTAGVDLMRQLSNPPDVAPS